MAMIKQNTDGSLSILKENDLGEVFRAGGPKSQGAPAASTPSFNPGGTMKFGLIAGVVATTGGALMAWTNNLGYDIIITSAYIDVTTVSAGAANATVGQTPTSVTTSSANLVAAVSVASTGIKPSALAAKVKAGEFVTMTGSADTSGLVASLFLDWIPA